MQNRLQVTADPAAIPAERPEETFKKVVKRRVVIARHHQCRRVDGIDKGAGLLKLLVARALCQIARDRHQIGIQSVDPFQQWRHQFGAVSAKMQV